MTTPESITVSLEMAKKLKASGWPQKDYFLCSCCCFAQVEFIEPEPDTGWWRCSECWLEDDGISCPTADEILRRLPGIILTMESPCVLEAHFYPTLAPPHVTVGYMAAGLNETGWRTWKGKMLCEEADTLANAAAAMTCYLADNNLLPPL